MADIEEGGSRGGDFTATPEVIFLTPPETAKEKCVKIGCVVSASLYIGAIATAGVTLVYALVSVDKRIFVIDLNLGQFEKGKAKKK